MLQQAAPLPYHAERYQRYTLLWVRVIVRAAYDYALWKDSSNIVLRKFAQDAYRWLFEPSMCMNGFDSICELFELPKESIRKWAKNLDREHVRKLEFRERSGRDPLDVLLTPATTEEVAEDGDNR